MTRLGHLRESADKQPVVQDLKRDGRAANRHKWEGGATQEEDRREATDGSGAHTPRGRQLSDTTAHLQPSNFIPASTKLQQQGHKAISEQENTKGWIGSLFMWIPLDIAS